MKSRVYFIESVVAHIRKIVREISDDKISVYAAQASFFVITSAVPFISLLFALSSLFIPEGEADVLIGLTVPDSISTMINFIASEVQSAPGVSLLSISAITTLWSASRGIAAVRAGVETVYKSECRTNFVAHRMKSLISTLIFIVIITLTSAFLLFGGLLGNMLGESFRSIFMRLRSPLLIVIMSVIFTFMYVSIAKRSSHIRHDVILHLPGAVFSSLGWIVYSYFYSLYITNFPNASYIYGGLAAVCLIMLWIYFCMMILLLGAEVNKMYFTRIPDSRGRQSNK